MGLFGALLTLPLAPVRGTVWVAEQLQTEAERQLYDPEAIRRALLAAEIELEAGEIDATEYEAIEGELLDRLTVAYERTLATEEA